MIRVVELHAYSKMDPARTPADSLQFEVDGIVGDRHRGHLRAAFSNDKQQKGTMRRNERMWSAISVEELAQISADMGLDGVIEPKDVTANLCLEGAPDLSKLPKGSILRFPSGLELLVEEFCTPCMDKGEMLRQKYRRSDGGELLPTAFAKASKLSRGLVGIVEVAGAVSAGDTVEIIEYAHPSWLRKANG
ncbi:MAG: hypothetical protein QNJ05_02180 [Woeseiaceae bacterium]|nr:hypothetical protein [Woeseiaceae bacterium]